MKIFNLPDLGEGLPDAGIVEWHVKVGDHVKVDQLLVSVETAKAVVEIPSPQNGIIEELCGLPKEVLKTGQPLVIFKEEQVISEETDPGTVVGIIKTTPAVRALAKKLNVNLNSVVPSGPNNTIIREDLEKASANIVNDENDSGWSFVDHTTRTMALSMQKSLAEVVPATIFEDLILTNSINLDTTVNLMQAIVFACTLEPTLNAWFKRDHNNNFKQKLFSEVNLGIAVDSKEGLFVPVIKNVASKSADNLRGELNLLLQQIDSRTIALERLQHPTFILSNFGKFTGRYATPVILPPTVAILAVGKLRQIVVALKGNMVIKDCLPLSLTFDHRAVTGGQAARFLRAILKFFDKIDHN